MWCDHRPILSKLIVPRTLIDQTAESMHKIMMDCKSPSLLLFLLLLLIIPTTIVRSQMNLPSTCDPSVEDGCQFENILCSGSDCTLTCSAIDSCKQTNLTCDATAPAKCNVLATRNNAVQEMVFNSVTSHGAEIVCSYYQGCYSARMSNLD